MREGCSEAVCREETRINSHCRYRRLGQVMEHDGEFFCISFSVEVCVVPTSFLPERLWRAESLFLHSGNLPIRISSCVTFLNLSFGGQPCTHQIINPQPIVDLLR